MQLSPGEHKPKLTTRERALNHFERIDLNLSAAVRVSSMEVRWPMVVEEHSD